MKNSEFQKRRYEKSDSYDYIRSHGANRIKKTLSFFDYNKKATILDIGCGDGLSYPEILSPI